MIDDRDQNIQNILKQVRSLAARYYAISGKPLGVTGELAELAAAQELGIELEPARTTGYDGILDRDGLRLRVQIKGRAVDPKLPNRGRCPAIKCGGKFDIALLVLLDRATLLPIGMWEATEDAIAERLEAPGGKARNERKSLGISQFKSARDCRQVWPFPAMKRVA